MLDYFLRPKGYICLVFRRATISELFTRKIYKNNLDFKLRFMYQSLNNEYLQNFVLNYSVAILKENSGQLTFKMKYGKVLESYSFHGFLFFF